MMEKASTLGWEGPAASIAYDPEAVAARLHDLDRPCYVVRNGRGLGMTNDGTIVPPAAGSMALAASAPSLPAQQLGDAGFRETYGLTYAYMTGSMANAIASEDMVIALGQVGMLGAFGAGGLAPDRLEAAILRVQDALSNGPYAFNLIHSPNEPAMERAAVDLYLKHKVPVIEASAYLRLTPSVVRYRASGLSSDPEGNVRIGHRIIAKLSRREVARRFMAPAPDAMLRKLVANGAISPTQARLAARVPMADDVTVEGDSGGHTDRRPLVCLLPSLIALRDEMQAEYGFATPVRVGAAGGLGTPEAVLGAFMMGAAYVVTGSINHASVESGTSPAVKALLAEAEATDVMMAPAADMFEMGVQLQVLKRGTLFPMRARKLYELYETYDSIGAIPADEREKLETRVFQREFEAVWQDCVDFFEARDPRQIERAQGHPKRKMALIFRWYLGLATHWAMGGVKERRMDYQIWCGPAMGAFNDWARGSFLEDPAERHVVTMAEALMTGAARHYRRHHLQMQGIHLASMGQAVPLAKGATV
jgi:PfaD family protein